MSHSTLRFVRLLKACCFLPFLVVESLQVSLHLLQDKVFAVHQLLQQQIFGLYRSLKNFNWTDRDDLFSFNLGFIITDSFEEVYGQF